MKKQTLLPFDEKLHLLRERVKEYMNEKRYLHTLAVEREVCSLAEIFMPDEPQIQYKLRCAALLHDITKILSFEKQLQYCQIFDIILRNGDELSPKIFHAKTGAEVAKRDFAEFVDDEVLAGIRWHTTGRDGMSLFECIIYLADYIEDTRTFKDCVELRQYFYNEINKPFADKELVLYKTMVLSFDMTVDWLLREGALIDMDTVEARNYFIKKIKK